MSKPTFLFVPGAWNTPEYYAPLIERLSHLGYPSPTVALPSVGCTPGKYDFTEDVEAIKDALVELIEEEGKDVVLVTHSYSGQPGQEAVKDLGKHQREEKGLKGGVVRLIFVMANMVPEGFISTARGSTVGFRDWMQCDMEKGIVTLTPAAAKKAFFHDLPDAEAERWASVQKTQSIGVYWSVTTHAAWRYIPSTYVMCTDDRAFTVQYAEYQIGLCRETKPCLLESVETIEAGHFPMLSKTGELAEVLVRVVGRET